MEVETLRRKYRPAKVRVLFVGESPPTGGRFFYVANSKLFREVAMAFRQVFGSQIGEGEEFLEYFQKAGCYLEDLCLQPVNRMPDHERRRSREAGEPELTQKLKTHMPSAVIAVLVSIRGHVKIAMTAAGLTDVPLYSVPFPTMGHQPRFREALVSILDELSAQGVLHMPSSK